MWKSELADKKWLLYGCVSDVGWMAFFAALVVYMLNGADGLGTVVLSVLFLLTALSALAVLAGIIELISQRIRKLNRVLNTKQLALGFGGSVFGAMAGGIFTLAAIIVDLVYQLETGACFAAQCVMCAGCWVCFLFGLPILRSFHRERK